MAVKVGVLGLAHGHVMTYGRKWIEHPEWGIELVCGWDRDKARRDANTAQLGIKAAESVDEVLGMCDAVVISSETCYHAELVEAAAAAGKDIICLKPMR